MYDRNTFLLILVVTDGNKCGRPAAFFHSEKFTQDTGRVLTTLLQTPWEGIPILNPTLFSFLLDVFGILISAPSAPYKG